MRMDDLAAVDGQVVSVARASHEGGTPSALLKLLTFLSPVFPVGAFSYSHGLEWLIHEQRLAGPDAFQAWLADLLEIGSGWNDAVLFVEAYRAGQLRDERRLLDAAELGEGLAGSRERHLETMAQGRAFLAAALEWPCLAGNVLRRAGGAPYPVAVSAVAAGHGIPLEAALPAYLNAFAGNLISVGVRLVPLGQTAGLRILAALHPVILAAAERAGRSNLSDLGSATVLADIASMRHEEQHSRVFRS